MSGSDVRGLFVRVPEELYFLVKIRALQSRVPLAGWVQEALRDKLASREEPKPASE